MSKIPEQFIQRLRSSRLFVSDPWPSSHVWPDHVLVGKPIGVSGNSIPGYKFGFGLGEDSIEFDAPPVRLICDSERWFVLAEDFTPGPGPGDFLDAWKTADEAVEDILDFYFGDPRRMQDKADARARKTKSQSDTDVPKTASTSGQ